MGNSSHSVHALGSCRCASHTRVRLLCTGRGTPGEKKILHQRYQGNHGRRSRRRRRDSIFADGEYFSGVTRCAVRSWCRGGQFTALDYCEWSLLKSESRSEWCWHSTYPWTHRAMGVMEWGSNAVRWSRTSASPAVSCFQTVPAPTRFGGCVSPVLFILSKSAGNGIPSETPWTVFGMLCEAVLVIHNSALHAPCFQKHPLNTWHSKGNWHNLCLKSVETFPLTRN